MDIQFFNTFLTVAKLGSMTQAAQRLNFTQPTITGQIRTLEQEFGVRLFERVGKKLYITDAGRKLLDYAEKLMALYDEAHEELRIQPEKVKLGLAAAMINYIMLPFLQEFQKRQPECSVSMEMCPNTAVVVKGLLENKFDLGFTQNEVSIESLTGFEVFKEELVWVVHQQAAKACQGSTNIADYPLLSYKKGGLFSTFYEKTLEKGRLKPVIEYSDSESMKNAILQGLGCGALPLMMIKPLLAEGTLIEFSSIDRSAFTIWVVYHRDKVLSPAAMNLLQIVQGEQHVE